MDLMEDDSSQFPKRLGKMIDLIFCLKLFPFHVDVNGGIY